MHSAKVFIYSFLLVLLGSIGLRLLVDIAILGNEFSDIGWVGLILTQIGIAVLVGIGVMIAVKKKNEK